jgi:heterodisulfide reductase subunit B
VLDPAIIGTPDAEKAKAASDHGAHLIVALCPVCQMNVEAYQQDPIVRRAPSQTQMD